MKTALPQQTLVARKPPPPLACLPRSDHVSVMKVYFLRLTGKLEPPDQGWFEVSSYSGWECLAR